MPRILTPNSSFQRRGSKTYRVSYRPANAPVAPQQRPRRYSDAGPSYADDKSAASFRSWQYYNNTPPSSERGSPPPPPPHQLASAPPPQPSRTTQASPNSRFRIVSRRKSLPDEQACRSSFIPSHAKEEDAWGQFVDVMEEEEKIIRASRILSR